MDNVLVPYLTADDDGHRQQHLEQLLTFRVAPIVRQVLRQRLGFYVSSQGANKNNQDAEDLYQEAMMRVVQVLNQLQLPSGIEIENFDLYVSRIVSNTCTDFLRAQSPARTRLKDSLRDLLNRHRDFSMWEQEGKVLCGFKIWRNTGKRAFSDQGYEDLETKLQSFQSVHFADEDVRLAPVSQLVAELFHWTGGPIAIDVLVRLILHLRNIKDPQIESLDNPSPARWEGYAIANSAAGESHVEANELLARLWRAVIKLPPEQRDVFAFGFEDEAGQDLFTVLLTSEIVNWDELARAMGRSTEEVVRLRLQMPMDGATLANELSASRENVYKWRFRAIRRLQIELRAQK